MVDIQEQLSPVMGTILKGILIALTAFYIRRVMARMRAQNKPKIQRFVAGTGIFLAIFMFVYIGEIFLALTTPKQ